MGIVNHHKVIAQFSTSQHNPIDSTQTSKSETSKSTKIVVSQTKFSLALFKEIIRENPQNNTFISPFSTAIALSMLYNGSEGVTRKELSYLLAVSNLSVAEVNEANKLLVKELENSDSKTKLSIANSLWRKKDLSIKKSFLKTNRRYYDATIKKLDFTKPNSANIINDWVADKTEDKITKIVDRISPDKALFLINAIYFKGEWQNKFNPETTKTENFYLASGNLKQHPLMSSFGEYKYYENQNFQLINLPYGSGRLGMNIFLPQKTSNLTKLFELLDSESLNDWLGEMKLKEGTIKFPRFKQEYEVDLNDILKQLGASSMFNPSKANFTALTDDSIAVDEIKHKAVIEVNEEGTEAAAVTSIGLTTTSVNVPFNMIVNRPFFYTIQDNETGAIIFMGTIQNPQE